MSHDAEKTDSSTPRRRPRFTLTALLLAMLVFCMMSAAISYLLPVWLGGAQVRTEAIIFILAAPALLMVLISVSLRVLAWLAGKRG